MYAELARKRALLVEKQRSKTEIGIAIRRVRLVIWQF
jgi:hypothetical protein